MAEAMTIPQMFAEYRKGCTDAPPEAPERCEECTRAFIGAIERRLASVLTWDMLDALNSEMFPVPITADVRERKARESQLATDAIVRLRSLLPPRADV